MFKEVLTNEVIRRARDEAPQEREELINDLDYHSDDLAWAEIEYKGDKTKIKKIKEDRDLIIQMRISLYENRDSYTFEKIKKQYYHMFPLNKNR